MLKTKRYNAAVLSALFCLAFACSPPSKTTSRPQQTSPVRPAGQTPGNTLPVPEKPVLGATHAGIAWYESEYLMPVLEEAQKQNKLVFLTFHASWCAPCKVMEEEVFSQKSVSDYLNEHFLSYKADFDALNGKRIAGVFEVSSLPTSLFVHTNGVALERKTGMLTISDVFRLGDAALRKK